MSSGEGTDLSFILGGQGDTSAPAAMDPSTFSTEIRAYKSSYRDDEAEYEPSAPPSVVDVPLKGEDPATDSLSKRLFGAFKNKKKPSSSRPAESQRIAPAEQLLTAAPAPIEVRRGSPLLRALADHLLEQSRIAEFTSTYEKVLLFRPESNEIIFVTSAFLRHCGLPGSSLRDVYASPLLHMDFSRLLGGEAAEKREARAKFKKAVKARESLSMPCVIRFKEKGA